MEQKNNFVTLLRQEHGFRILPARITRKLLVVSPSRFRFYVSYRYTTHIRVTKGVFQKKQHPTSGLGCELTRLQSNRTLIGDHGETCLRSGNVYYNVEDLEDGIQKVWDELEIELMTDLVKSFSKRSVQAVEAKRRVTEKSFCPSPGDFV